MSPRYLRNRPSARDDLVAGLVSGAVAVGVGLAVFYLSRLLLAREPVSSAVPAERTDAFPEGR